jgi:vitamin B12 transporter
MLAGLAVGHPAVPFAQEATLERLEEIVVTSSIIETPRRQIGTAVSVISGDEIELRGYDSIADLLRTQPGIGVSNAGGIGKTTTLRIRGEENFRTLLLIDGVKAVDPSAPQVTPGFESLVTTGDLERVEILRGPQGFIYGADAGGVVNVLTRTGRGPVGGQLGIDLGDAAARKLDASIAGGGERADYFVSVADFQTDGFNAQTADSVLRDDDGTENTTLHAKIGWNPTENLRLQWVARDIDATTLSDSCFSLITSTTIHDCINTTEQTTYRVSAAHSMNEFSNVVAYSKADIARDNFSAGVNEFATRGSLDRFEYTGSYRLSDSLTLVYGLDFQGEEVLGDARLTRDQAGYYLEYQGTFGERFFLSAGARYDDNDDFGAHTSGRLSGAYVQELSSGDSLKYRASAGTGFRSPSLYEIAYNVGPFAFPPASGVTLAEESSAGYDVGIEFDRAGGLHVEFTYFDQTIEDEIFFDLAGFSGYLQSSGTGTSTGFEVAVEVPLGSRWEILGNWTNNQTRDTAQVQRLRRPKYLSNVGVLYASPNDRLRLMLNYRLSRDAIDIGNVGLDDYAVLDASMIYSVSDKLELHARIENAGDQQYQELIGYNTAGRGAYAGVRLRF